MSNRDALFEEGYEQAGWDMVDVHENLEVPVSDPVCLNFAEEYLVEDVAEVVQVLEQSERFVLVAPYSETGNGGKFYVSSTVYDGEANVRFNVKMTSTGVRVFPKKDRFSLETLKVFANYVADELDVEYAG